MKVTIEKGKFVKPRKQKLTAKMKKELLKKGVEEEQFCHYDGDFYLQMWDVWGCKGDDYTGMIVARSEQKCPVWRDKLPYKSVTVICNTDQFNEVTHWLSYVHGGMYSNAVELKGGKVAIRSDYQAW